MKKIVLFVLSYVLCLGLDARLVSVEKYNPELGSFLKSCRSEGVEKAMKSRSLKVTSHANPTLKMVLYCNNQQEVLSELQKMGASSHVITPSVLTADVPVDKIESLIGNASVRRVSALHKNYVHLVNARNTTSANLVHEGASLETPYTGKGVVTGLLDVGLQFNHPAFKVTNDSTRILAAWDVNQPKSKPIYGSADIIAYGDDEQESTHGTHVMGILAGGKELGSKTYYGMAPEANIVATSACYLSTEEILEAISLTKQVAESKGLPWVFNLSLGDDIHSHDGYDDLSLTLDTIIMNGGHIVASAGNSGGDSIHAQHLFVTKGEKKMILMNHSKKQMNLEVLSNDSTEFDIDVFIYNTTDKTLTSVSQAAWDASGSGLAASHNIHTSKYELKAIIEVENLLSNSNQRIAFEVKSKAANQLVDVWVQSDGAVLTCPDETQFMKPDICNQICSPAIARNVIAVGAYNSSVTWTTIEGKSYRYKNNTGMNNLSAFSSVGTASDETLLKPDICAPGSPIGSSVKNYISPYTNKNYITDEVTIDGTTSSYGVMQGTSMSSPAAAGIIALWLQANPNLTHKQIMKVLRESCTPFTGQSANEWDYRYGYGKIDAYKGLKAVLSIPSGIATVTQSTTPVSLLKMAHEWRILFNSSETYAHICVYSLKGTKLMDKTLNHPERGQEEILSFHEMAKGVYIVDIQTPMSRISRKLIIK